MFNLELPEESRGPDDHRPGVQETLLYPKSKGTRAGSDYNRLVRVH